MTEKRLSLGINVSILLILTIFGVLLSLPLRLLFDTNYDNRDGKETGDDAMDHRKLKRCPNLPYEDRLLSVFLTDYDGNCTYVRDDDDVDDDGGGGGGDDGKSDEEENSRENIREIKRGVDQLMKENAEELLKSRQTKSVTVAGHILVAMLLVSVVAALVEVLRIRFEFAREKDSSRASTTISRRCSSSVDLPAPSRPTSRESIRRQKSFEIQGMHRSALRLLGAPPLIRRSSFPTPQAKQAASLCATPTNQRLTRRQSAESDEETRVVTNVLHHRTRLIRRH